MKRVATALLILATLNYLYHAKSKDMVNIHEEIWKDITGYEGVYQISNKGRVKALPRTVNSCIRNNPTVLRKERILKLAAHTFGYKQVRLQFGDLDDMSRVHRLVAQAFLPNPENYPVVNHIDNNPANNDVSNLEWCTQSHNIKEAFRQGRKKAPDFFFKSEFGRDNPCSKQVRQLSLNGDFIREWDCVSYIERDLGFCRPNICKVCKGKASTAYGFKWEYV